MSNQMTSPGTSGSAGTSSSAATTGPVITGLTCPRCGGIVPIPEGQAIVICPYCDLRSAVIAEPLDAAPRPAQRPQPAPPQPVPPLQEAPPRQEALPPAHEEGDLFAGFPSAAGTTAPQRVEPLPPAGEMIKAAPAARDSNSLSALDERRGVLRYQAPLRVTREQAVSALRDFLGGKFQVARDAANKAQVSEAFVVHLPFWAVWGRGVAYAFGQQKVGSGDKARYEPREKKVVREMSWNAPACEVGEFGVQRIGLEGCPLEPFNPDSLHRSGMVFEPVGSAQTALEAARRQFEDEIRKSAHLSRVSQLFTRLTRPRLGLLYYPLWVVRYLYHGRAFQVVVDGVDGKILYGKAPGSVGYRAGVLVGGMAVGSLVTIDIPAAVMMLGSSDSEDSPLAFAAVAFVVGLGILWWAYHTFRHAEHYEYHRFKGKADESAITNVLPGDVQDLGRTMDEVRKGLEGMR